ncbi:MAG: hypothetical protein ACD_10C00381G0001, partial [uncultured bacterium]
MVSSQFRRSGDLTRDLREMQGVWLALLSNPKPLA